MINGEVGFKVIVIVTIREIVNNVLQLKGRVWGGAVEIILLLPLSCYKVKILRIIRAYRWREERLNKL